MPHYALITPDGSALGAFELDAEEARDSAIIRRDGRPDRRVVGRVESDDPERFEILVVEQVAKSDD
jgi:hypothetical protein